jgi:molybdopterin-guanine dinucleotide biosynthesis protein B
MFASPPHVGFAAPSGTGKTTLLTRLVPILSARGLRLGYLKHAHHGFDLDTPGKDSHRLRTAGADAVLIASATRWALMQENADQSPGLYELLARFDAEHTDLVLIEGWHGDPYPKIAVHRPSAGREPLHFDDPDLIAVATEAPEQVPDTLPCLPLNEPERIADFILAHPLMHP